MFPLLPLEKTHLSIVSLNSNWIDAPKTSQEKKREAPLQGMEAQINPSPYAAKP